MSYLCSVQKPVQDEQVPFPLILVHFGYFCNKAQNVSTFEPMRLVAASLAKGLVNNPIESWMKCLKYNLVTNTVALGGMAIDSHRGVWRLENRLGVPVTMPISK